jgi:diguanylate cyclase (GGDEF)-like protein
MLTFLETHSMQSKPLAERGEIDADPAAIGLGSLQERAEMFGEAIAGSAASSVAVFHPAAWRMNAEAARLDALRTFEVLDTGRDTRIDALTRAAAALFCVPGAAVSLIDADRLWNKSLIGMDIQQVPRGQAFAPYLLDIPGPVMIVEDARLDPRFAAIPTVAGPEQVRFYAGAKLLDGNGHVLGALCVFDRKPGTATQAQLDQLAELAAAVVTALELHRSQTALGRSLTHDAITGLPHRATLLQRAAEAIGSDDPRRCALVTVDLGRFSQVTDLAGHAGGEALLRQAALRLRAAAADGSVVARLGGDEFAVLLPRIAHSDEAQALADELIDRLSQPFTIDGVPIVVSPSIGIATCPEDAGTADDLLRRSADAVYWAKRRGRNQSHRFDAGLHRVVIERHMLERDLRAALAANTLTLEWQPFVTAVTGCVLGYEALLRWHRPGYGIMPPGKVMAVAEACQLAAAIDRWVLDAACQAAAAWAEPMLVSVNLSASCFSEGGLASTVARTLQANGLAAGRLQLEVGSQAFFAPGLDVQAEVAGLKQLGVWLALNDFGGGQAMLGRIRALPFDTIKLDRSLLDGVEDDERARAVALAVLQIGRMLEIPLCAARLETEAEYLFMAENGCDQVQGAFIALPGQAPADPRFEPIAARLLSDPADLAEPFRALQGIWAGIVVSALMWAGLWLAIR